MSLRTPRAMAQLSKRSKTDFEERLQSRTEELAAISDTVALLTFPDAAALFGKTVNFLQVLLNDEHDTSRIFLLLLMLRLNLLFPVKFGWAAKKRFEVSKFKFKFPRARTYEHIRARPRLYRSQILQVNTRWKGSRRDLHNALLRTVLESNPKK